MIDKYEITEKRIYCDFKKKYTYSFTKNIYLGSLKKKKTPKHHLFLCPRYTILKHYATDFLA